MINIKNYSLITLKKAGLPLGIIALLGFLPLLIPSEYFRHLLIIAMLYGVIASSWDLSLGYAGIFNFAHIALFAIGAYTSGFLSKFYGLSSILCILGGIVITIFFTIIITLPLLRVKGIYVCLVTTAFARLCQHLVLALGDYTGGSFGMVMIPHIKIFGYSFAQNDKMAYYYLVLLLLIGNTFFLRSIVKSKLGLGIIALRDFEDLASARGVNVSRIRILTFAASAVFTGAAGAIYAFYLNSVSVELFGFGYITTILSMILLGGTATIYGPIIGAFVMTFVSEYMVSLGPWRFIIIAVMIILIITFYPDGIFAAIKSLISKFPKRRDTSIKYGFSRKGGSKIKDEQKCTISANNKFDCE